MAPGPKRFAMALYYDLPVYQDVYKLILMIFGYTGGSHESIRTPFGST